MKKMDESDDSDETTVVETMIADPSELNLADEEDDEDDIQEAEVVGFDDEDSYEDELGGL